MKPYAGAVRMEGRAWAIDEEVQPKPHFWGTTVDINLNWLLRLTFMDGDAYEWRKACALCAFPNLLALVLNDSHTCQSSHVNCAMQVTSTINGILQGPSKVFLSHRGALVVRSLASSLAAHIDFPASGKRLTRGVVRTSSARQSSLLGSATCCAHAHGGACDRRASSWRTAAGWISRACMARGTTSSWPRPGTGRSSCCGRRAPRLQTPRGLATLCPAAQRLHLPNAPKCEQLGAPARRWQAPTSFFFRLNEMTEELKARLPPTDSRWRADVRAMEEGRYSEVCTVAVMSCLCLHDFLFLTNT